MRIFGKDGDYEALERALGQAQATTAHPYPGVWCAAQSLHCDQIRFLRSVREVFLKKRTLVEADLFELPLTFFRRNAVDRYFTPEEIRELLELLQALAA